MKGLFVDGESKGVALLHYTVSSSSGEMCQQSYKNQNSNHFIFCQTTITHLMCLKSVNIFVHAT